ncbi:TetR family transcriptional regulator C-terminal domain-containing protein [Sinomonas sp. ASV322]|uniref:TetR/AcrR family transcriptional regulator n=1 Tax=Sinomonas sp. ASV322 TaxID=3041920 RepID=UPI0027DCD31B|nr:TetR family transcriptional regulator C-terminal domain-containing protein [Sinomonas sp. ASV322]MDQ4503364.1 TetR family transcriptional regulator C-terminal domain-containing protein [Sinomonas sp. ASV322]
MPRFVDAAARRREIVEAVKRIVAADGLARVSLREVAAEAGLVVGSVRHYFDTAEELRVHALEAVADDVAGRVEAEADLVAQLCQLLPLDEARAVDLCVLTAFRLAARTDAALLPVADAAHARVAAVVGRSVRAALPDVEPHELVAEAERLLATVEGLALHALVHGRWLDADLCLAVVVAQAATLGRVPIS